MTRLPLMRYSGAWLRRPRSHSTLRPGTAARLLVALQLVQACSEPDPLTQVAVTIDGDPVVMKQLRRIDAKVYRTDAPEHEQPVSHVFSLPAGSASDPPPPIEPLSFGIQRGTSDHFQLVVEGFASGEAHAAPVIERKLYARFEPKQTRALRVHLASACVGLSSPCRSLKSTCRASARACAAVEEQETTEHPAPEPTGVRPAGDDGVCSAAPSCRLPDYPCTPTSDTGYTCLGQSADWPMPDRAPGAKYAPQYDDAGSPGLVRDSVTGLYWQRDLPEVYSGCTGTTQTAADKPGSACTWDEAKIYCSELVFGGRRFRLPSKIELESIVDPTLPAPPFDTRIFPGRGAIWWTSSPDVTTLGQDPVDAFAVTWPGTTVPMAVNTPLPVRCVSGTPAIVSTPGRRYLADGDVVQDLHTMLTWRRTASPPLDSEDDAAAFCEALGGGFRAPTYKELLTLVDPTRQNPAIDPIFIGTPSAPFWSTPLPTRGPQGPLLVHFLHGASYPMDARRNAPQVDVGKPRVRCVR